eukprot:296041-Rhodomonas_salina.2
MMLRMRYAVSSTDLELGCYLRAMPYLGLKSAMLLPGSSQYCAVSRYKRQRIFATGYGLLFYLSTVAAGPLCDCTDIGYAAMRLLCNVQYGTNNGYAPTRPRRGFRTTVHASGRPYPMSAYGLATRCPVLTRALSAYAQSGTDISGSGVAYGALLRCHVDMVLNVSLGPLIGTICLRLCYAMSGTDIACGTICPHFCYAMSGTDLAYPATSHCGGPKWRWVPNTSSAYAAATRCPQTHASRPQRTWYHPTECYAMSGTDIKYAATRCLRDVRMGCTDLGTTFAMTLRICCAISGTELAYAATRVYRSYQSTNVRVICLRICWAMFGTSLASVLLCSVLIRSVLHLASTELCDVQYCCLVSAMQYPVLTDHYDPTVSATRLCPYAVTMHRLVLTETMLLRSCYAMSGTDVGYAITTRHDPSYRHNRYHEHPYHPTQTLGYVQY